MKVTKRHSTTDKVNEGQEEPSAAVAQLLKKFRHAREADSEETEFTPAMEETLKRVLAHQHAAQEKAARAEGPEAYKQWQEQVKERKALIGPPRW